MTDDSDLGNTVQSRVMATQIARAAIAEYVLEHPESARPAAELHPLVKWLVGAIAAFGSAALIGLGFWIVTSISTMQQTLTRLDERIQNGAVRDGRYEDLDRRVTTLEGYHKGNGQ